MPENHENQLELFELGHQPAAKPHRETFGRLLLHLRYDQIALSSIAILLGLTVVFAAGVERGKQLVRTEHALVARQPPSATPSSTTAERTEPTESVKKTSTAEMQKEKKNPSAPATVPLKVKERTRLAADRKSTSGTAQAVKASKSRYAVQVVSFARPQLAKQEMDHLRSRGEPAFLVIRDGRTIVYVGPFPSKVNASDKLVTLRTQYQDCFIKTL